MRDTITPEDPWTSWPPVGLTRDSATRLVRVLEQIEPVMEHPDISPWVLVGGLAVQIWVTTDRATEDIDLSVENRDTTAMIVRTQLVEAEQQRNGVTIDGVKVDFLEAVDPALFPDAHHDEDWYRNLAWFEALRLRRPRTVIAVEEHATHTLTVPAASPGILLAMKLAAIAAAAPDAQSKRAKEKQGSDVYDVVTLIEAAGGDRLVHDLRQADPRLLERAAEQATRWLVDAQFELAQRTTASTNITVATVSSTRIEQCGFDLSEAFDQPV